MWMTNGWEDYALLDSGNGEKLERWGAYILIRPEPQAVWPRQTPALWDSAHAVYHRSHQGGGSWQCHRSLPQYWNIHYRTLSFRVRPTEFKHTGLFPEQAVNWDFFMDTLKNSPQKKEAISILNLFAYTGGATMACAKLGVQVTHVDAAKGMVAWAKENARLCGLSNASVRYLVDDALKFIKRELRRGKHYQGIIMDPPSYGRGPTGEMFRFETHVYPLLEAAAKLLSDDALFFLLNSYTAGFAPQVAENALRSALSPGHITADNIGIPCETGLPLPCGATARWQP